MIVKSLGSASKCMITNMINKKKGLKTAVKNRMREPGVVNMKNKAIYPQIGVRNLVIQIARLQVGN